MNRVRLTVAGLVLVPVLAVAAWTGGPDLVRTAHDSGAAAIAPTAETGRTDPAGPTHADREAAADARAVASVRSSVRRARRGTPLPRRTRPTVGPRLSAETATLGRCDYGIPHDSTGGPLCPRGDPDGDRTVVVLGDSHGRHWTPGIDHAAHADGWRAYYLVKQQCTASMVANGDPAAAHPSAPWAACRDFRSWAIDTIGRLQPDLVVVSTSVPTKGLFTRSGYTTDPTDMVGPFAQGFDRLWRRLRAVSDARLVLLRDVPARLPGTDPTTCFAARHATLRTCLSPRTAPGLARRIALVDASVRSARRAGVEVVDPTDWFCWNGRCPGVIGHYLPYRNLAHLTTEWSRHLAGALAHRLGL